MLGKKTGGRQKGTQNKVTTMSKMVINELLSNYSESGKLNEDFELLEPKERITVAEKLMQYVMPKMQSTSVNVSADDESRKTLEETLIELSKDPD